MCFTNDYNVINRIFRCFIINNITVILTEYIVYVISHLEFQYVVRNHCIE